jgi:hypothetical protein
VKFDPLDVLGLPGTVIESEPASFATEKVVDTPVTSQTTIDAADPDEVFGVTVVGSLAPAYFQ